MKISLPIVIAGALLGLPAWAQAQNVGIGDAAPAARLEVRSQSDATDVFRLENSAGTSMFHIGGNGAWYLSGSAGTSGQVLTSGGTGGPPTWTTVSGGAGEDLTLAGSLGYTSGTAYNGSTARTLQLTGGAANKVTFWTGTNSVSNNANFHWDNTNTRLGIGNAAPGHRLHVTGDFRVDGDFVNQGLTWGQSYANYVGYLGTLRTQAVTVGASGASGSAVLINGQVDYYKNSTTTWVSLHLYRGTTELIEVSQLATVGADNSLQMQWVDEPGAGTHTYYLRYNYPSGSIGVYGTSLHITEIKR